jgi:hypothetical protein
MLEIITIALKYQDTSKLYSLPVMNLMTVCAVNYVMGRISVMLDVTSFGLVCSL